MYLTKFSSLTQKFVQEEVVTFVDYPTFIWEIADFILKEKSFFHYKRNLLGFLKKITLLPSLSL